MTRSTPIDWQMFSTEGNAEAAKMMQEVRMALSEYPLLKVRSTLKSKIESISMSHSEIYDTVVRDSIVYQLTKWACEINELSTFSLSPDY